MRSTPSGGWDSAVRLGPGVDLIARAAVGVETSKKTCAQARLVKWALGGIVAQLLFSVRLSFRATDPSQTRHTRMGETTAAAPLRRRGLVHACLIVIHNWRKPALDLRDAHAIAAGVIPRVLSLARSRDAAVWHPNKREYQEP